MEHFLFFALAMAVIAFLSIVLADTTPDKDELIPIEETTDTSTSNLADENNLKEQIAQIIKEFAPHNSKKKEDLLQTPFFPFQN